MVAETDEAIIKRAEQLLDSADARVREGSYEETFSVCDDLDDFVHFWKVSESWRAPAALQRGKAYWLTDHLLEAEGQYELVIRHAATDELRAVGYTGYASGLYVQKRADAALQACNKAIQLDPESESEYLPHCPPMKLAALIHHRRNQPAKAAEYGGRALKFYPDDIELLKLMAMVYRELGKYEEGIEYCENGLNLDLNVSEMWMVRSQICASSRKYAEAEASLDVLLSIEQDNDAAHLGRLYRGFARGRQGKHEEALSDLNVAEDKLSSRYSVTKLCRADIYMQQGRYEKALADYDTVMGLMPCLPEMKILYIEAFYEAGRYGEALETCDALTEEEGHREDVSMAYRHILAAMRETPRMPPSNDIVEGALFSQTFPPSLRIREKVLRDMLGLTPIVQLAAYEDARWAAFCFRGELEDLPPQT